MHHLSSWFFFFLIDTYSLMHNCLNTPIHGEVNNWEVNNCWLDCLTNERKFAFTSYSFRTGGGTVVYGLRGLSVYASFSRTESDFAELPVYSLITNMTPAPSNPTFLFSPSGEFFPHQRLGGTADTVAGGVEAQDKSSEGG